MKFAPVALFTYNRPIHTRKTIEALKKNKLASQSDLIIFSDGPKKPEAEAGVKETRAYLKTVGGFNNVTVVERAENFGLAKSIITGVSEIVNKYGKIIVIEDDLITSPFFLQYMNEGLDFYENQEDVISIHGYIYPVEKTLPLTFFIKGADCWGWATWKRGWDLFEADGAKLLKELEDKNLAKEFDFNNSYPYAEMLKGQIEGRNNSWAIRWYASAFLKNKLTLYPGKSLVQNIGFDNSGTHCGDDNDQFEVIVNTEELPITPIKIEEDKQTKYEIEKYFKKITKNRLFFRIIRKLKKILKSYLNIR